MKAALAMALLSIVRSYAQTGTGAEPVRYMGGVSIDLTSPDGKLRPAIGVENAKSFAPTGRIRNWPRASAGPTITLRCWRIGMENSMWNI